MVCLFYITVTQSLTHFQDDIHYGEESVETGPWSSWSYCFCIQEDAEGDGCWYSAHFLSQGIVLPTAGQQYRPAHLTKTHSTKPLKDIDLLYNSRAHQINRTSHYNGPDLDFSKPSKRSLGGKKKMKAQAGADETEAQVNPGPCDCLIYFGESWQKHPVPASGEGWAVQEQITVLRLWGSSTSIPWWVFSQLKYLWETCLWTFWILPALVRMGKTEI